MLDAGLQEPRRVGFIDQVRGCSKLGARVVALLSVAAVNKETCRFVLNEAGATPPLAIAIVVGCYGRRSRMARRRHSVGGIAITRSSVHNEIADLAFIDKRGIPDIVFSPEAV